MKKSIILAAGALLAATAVDNASAQSYISIGKVGSMGHSWVTNMPGNADFKLSPAMGVSVLYSRCEHWGFGEELLVSHEGYKADYALQTGGEEKMTVNPVYLSMPMHVSYFFGKFGDRIRPKVYAGTTVALRVDERRFYSMDQPAYTEGMGSNETQFRRFDVGLNGGVGANIKVCKKMWVDIDGGYYHGLIDAVKSQEGYNVNSNFRLNAGVMYGL